MYAAVLFDIDGVLTDGTIWVDADGREAKRIRFDDIDAIFALRRSGLRIGFVTAESGPFGEYVRKRFAPDFFASAATNKWAVIAEWLEREGLSPRGLVYVGDSEKDIDALRHAGLGLAPRDAAARVRAAANQVLSAGRGEGVVRETAELVLGEITLDPAPVARAEAIIGGRQNSMGVSGRVVYVNGSFVAEAEAKISIYDSALMFGDMVFEMTRSFGGRQFKLREHLRRLFASIRYVQIPMRMSMDELESACLETVRRNQPVFAPDDEHRLMINVSRGPLGIYADIFGGKLEPTVVVADFPLRWTVAGMGALFDTGINAVVTSQRAIPASLLDAKVKSRSRLHYMMANIEASHWAGDNNWALLLDPDGYVAEGTGDNFFVVRGGSILTPEPRNILRGISRDYIFELAKQLGLPCAEANLEPYDVLESEEAFMTGTPFCLLPVTALNGVAVGDGCPGPVTRRLLARWSESVGVDIAGQIRAWNAQAVAAGAAAQAATPYRFRK